MIYKPKSCFDVTTECAKIMLITKSFEQPSVAVTRMQSRPNVSTSRKRRRETSGERDARRSKQCLEEAALQTTAVYRVCHTEACRGSKFLFPALLFFCITLCLELPVKLQSHAVISGCCLCEVAENA